MVKVIFYSKRANFDTKQSEQQHSSAFAAFTNDACKTFYKNYKSYKTSSKSFGKNEQYLFYASFSF